MTAPLKMAMWVSGTAAQEETAPKTLKRVGWGTGFELEPGHSCWFHFAIPTPVIIDDERVAVRAVYVLYALEYHAAAAPGFTPYGIKIADLHIYDGGNKIREFNNVNRHGDHSHGLDSQNTWLIAPPITIYYGLGLSIKVVAEGWGNSVYSGILCTAGADFQ